jgi:hypothetical protein
MKPRLPVTLTRHVIYVHRVKNFQVRINIMIIYGYHPHCPSEFLSSYSKEQSGKSHHYKRWVAVNCSTWSRGCRSRFGA